ncbi:hypothetical protein PUN28_001788 [Cardiocondyla obscurior]|uniref:Ribosomal protein S18 n=1 Tax=Cardiocondyla obscurior TaxID=286306 RepID=A0AAW2GRA0_9HYME
MSIVYSFFSSLFKVFKINYRTFFTSHYITKRMRNCRIIRQPENKVSSSEKSLPVRFHNKKFSIMRTFQRYEREYLSLDTRSFQSRRRSSFIKEKKRTKKKKRIHPLEHQTSNIDADNALPPRVNSRDFARRSATLVRAPPPLRAPFSVPFHHTSTPLRRSAPRARNRPRDPARWSTAGVWQSRSGGTRSDPTSSGKVTEGSAAKRGERRL